MTWLLNLHPFSRSVRPRLVQLTMDEWLSGDLASSDSSSVASRLMIRTKSSVSNNQNKRQSRVSMSSCKNLPFTRSHIVYTPEKYEDWSSSRQVSNDALWDTYRSPKIAEEEIMGWFAKYGHSRQKYLHVLWGIA